MKSRTQPTSHSRNLVALVTGGNRGIGFEVCRQLARRGCHVILTSRNPNLGHEVVNRLRSESLDVFYIQLDVDSPDSVAMAKKEVEKRYERIDILVNNAGILPDNSKAGYFENKSVLDTPYTIFESALKTNALGALLVCQAFVPLVSRSKQGRIINVSSLVAQLSTMESGSPAYRISKVALNALTLILADELKDRNILVNSVSPGWVKTDMGGSDAHISIEEGANAIVQLAFDPSGATGQFFRQGSAIAW